MTCKSCRRDILESETWWGYHHVDHHDEPRQHVEKCIFCDTLLEEQSRTATRVTKYVWTIVRRARTRHIEESFTITFRPEINVSTAIDDTRLSLLAEDEKTMTKTFYLIPWVDSLHATKAIGPSTGSPSALDQVSAWIEHCNKHHIHCKRRVDQDIENANSDDPSPKRLVYVGDDESQIPYLVDVGELMKDPQHKGKGMPPYCTLSYCWGRSNNILQTTKDNLEVHMSPDPTKGLGKMQDQITFKHAIQVTRLLKVQYIWIDALCIIQGKGGDFHSEGAKMHTIYRNTYCTIAAAASKSSVGGLFRPKGEAIRDASKIAPVSVVLKEPSKLPDANPWLILPANLWEDQLITNSPLYTRGWVVQERMLSPRIIHFANEQLFWDCRTLSACEGFPHGLPMLLDTKAMTDREWRQRLQFKPGDREPDNTGDSMDTLWTSAVRHYTSCNLTNNEDKFNAIWGLAKVVGDISKQSFPAGLWEGNMAQQLAWQVVEPQRAFRPKTLSRNPSWSWASVQGAIDLNSRVDEEWDKLATNHEGNDISCQVISSDDDKQPKLERQALAIKSSLVEVTLVHASTSWTIMIDKEVFVSKVDVTLDSLRDVSGDLLHHHPHEESIDAWNPKLTKCFAMVLAGQPTYCELDEDEQDDQRWSGTGLILTTELTKHVESALSSATHFRRRGAFKFQNLEKGEWTALSTTCCPSLKMYRAGEDAKLWLE